MLRFALKICYTLPYIIATTRSKNVLMFNVITFCVNFATCNILRPNTHGKAESGPNLKAFRTQLCLTLFVKLSCYIWLITESGYFTLKFFIIQPLYPCTLHVQRFNHAYVFKLKNQDLQTI